MNERFGRVRKIHMVGIGGVGMSGIAEVLLNLGYVVTGSDLKESPLVSHLRDRGAQVHVGHRPDNVDKADVLVTSGAIDNANPELAVARERRIPIIPRAEMLAELMRFRYGIAVAGSHGKTTTTSLIANLLMEGDLDPTFVIGGRLESAGGGARLGAGRYLVAEADESDASFLLYKPMLSVVTNIDHDHLGAYGGDFCRLVGSFEKFLHQLPFYGRAFVCNDDPVLAKMAPNLGRPVWTYGLGPADFRATGIKADGRRMHFTVERPAGGPLELSLNLPGRHNVTNALAAVAIAAELEIPDTAIVKAMSTFHGIGRRLQPLGDFQSKQDSIPVVDDYAHHPREITATLEAVRTAWPGYRLIVVFQPHRYSRTRDLLDDFSAALDGVDVLLIGEVYPAGEKPIVGADARSLARAIRGRGRTEPVFVPDFRDLEKVLSGLVKAGDLILTLGAGDIGSHARRLVSPLGQGVT